jgi:hypothetical protein
MALQQSPACMFFRLSAGIAGMRKKDSAETSTRTNDLEAEFAGRETGSC